MTEAQQHREVSGEVQEVPRFVVHLRANASPRGEPDADEDEASGGRGPHPPLSGHEVPQLGKHSALVEASVGQQGHNRVSQHEEDRGGAHPAVPTQHAVESVALFEPTGAGHEQYPSERREGCTEAAELSECHQRGGAAGEEAVETTVAPPQAERYANDKGDDQRDLRSTDPARTRGRQTARRIQRSSTSGGRGHGIRCDGHEPLPCRCLHSPRPVTPKAPQHRPLTFPEHTAHVNFTLEAPAVNGRPEWSCDNPARA